MPLVTGYILCAERKSSCNGTHQAHSLQPPQPCASRLGWVERNPKGPHLRSSAYTRPAAHVIWLWEAPVLWYGCVLASQVCQVVSLASSLVSQRLHIRYRYIFTANLLSHE